MSSIHAGSTETFTLWLIRGLELVDWDTRLPYNMRIFLSACHIAWVLTPEHTEVAGRQKYSGFVKSQQSPVGPSRTQLSHCVVLGTPWVAS